MADFSETFAIQRRLVEASDQLIAMADEVAVARQVREHDGDRRRRCLAIAAAPLLAAGSSSAASDTEARASEAYGKGLKILAQQLVSAEKTIALWEATKIQIECARSLLAMQRDTMKNL